MTVTWVEETIRILVGIVCADLGDEVPESGEETLELTTDKKHLVDSKRLDGDSGARRRQRLASSRRSDHRASGDT